jgi:hypothetical protein
LKEGGGQDVLEKPAVILDLEELLAVDLEDCCKIEYFELDVHMMIFE